MKVSMIVWTAVTRTHSMMTVRRGSWIYLPGWWSVRTVIADQASCAMASVTTERDGAPLTMTSCVTSSAMSVWCHPDCVATTHSGQSIHVVMLTSGV